MKFDHIALVSDNIKKSVDWYVAKWRAEVVYQDDSWALIKVFGTKIAFVIKGSHPAHIGFEASSEFICENFNEAKFDQHRDGSWYAYFKDPDGNVVEVLNWDLDEEQLH